MIKSGFIYKNQEKVIDHGLSRLINNFICSQKDKEIIICDVLELTRCYLTRYRSNFDSMINIMDSPNMFRAVVLIFNEEKTNDKITKYCLKFLSEVVTYRFKG
jgi:hypothetical protein